MIIFITISILRLLRIICIDFMLKLMSIESLMTSNHLILCCPFLLLPSILPSIRVFTNESVLHIRWPKYWTGKTIALTIQAFGGKVMSVF